MKFSIYTDYKDYVMAFSEKGGERGLAMRCEKDGFDLLHGATVAVLRAFVSPLDLWPGVIGREEIFGLPQVGTIEVDPRQLIQAIREVEFGVGYACHVNANCIGLWRYLDSAAVLVHGKLVLK